MGTSGKVIRHDPDSYIPALLISFSKINEFKKYFEYQNEKGELSKIFNQISKNKQMFHFKNIINLGTIIFLQKIHLISLYLFKDKYLTFLILLS